MENSIEEFGEHLEEKLCEERSLDLLHGSHIDREICEAGKTKKRGSRKHRIRWMKRPMGLPEVIEELLEEEKRENAIRFLSNFLLEKREEDPENYKRAGIFLFHSCSTMSILLQEVITASRRIVDGSLNIRDSKRLANVLTLLQSVAANKEIRMKFAESNFVHFLTTLIISERTDEVNDNIRSIALSIIGILCQAREEEIIHWALENYIVQMCQIAITIGNELSKVIAMHILEAVLQVGEGLTYICCPLYGILYDLMSTWRQLVNSLSVNQEFSPRLLYHIIRCYVLLSADMRGFTAVSAMLPDPLKDCSFKDLFKEFPVIGKMHQQLMLNIGKVMADSPSDSGEEANTLTEESSSSSHELLSEEAFNEAILSQPA